MDGGRGFRGWMAAATVGVTLALLLLAVEKHIQIPPQSYFRAPQGVSEQGATTNERGILLTVDPGLAGTSAFPPTDLTPIQRRIDAPASAQGYLRRPPEPASGVILHAPVAALELTQLPLHATASNLDLLMETMDAALQSPLRTVTAQRETSIPPVTAIDSDRLVGLPSPANITGRIPEPKQLNLELAALLDIVDPRTSQSMRMLGQPPSRYVLHGHNVELSPTEADQIHAWILQVQLLLDRVVRQHGLEHPASGDEMRQLAELADLAPHIGESLVDFDLATRVIRTGYSLQRRVSVWKAIQACLDGTSIALNRHRGTSMAREDLRRALDDIEVQLAETGDGDAWRKYLLFDALRAWVESPQDIWTEGNDLAVNVLTRLRWQRLTATQKKFLDQPAFESLAEQLAAWSRDPVDYRQLLIDLEHVEETPFSRSSRALAGAVQVLRTSSEPSQQLVAAALNDHYRNANIRLSVSRDLIQRFLPTSEIEVRPIRRRIMGADTQGDTAVHTELSVRFLPDPSGWNVDVGVSGDMYSSTASSKGPATFHNTSTAQISSHRYIRLDPHGYQVSSEPTNVSSQDYLRKMNTDYDSLPIIGDFVRLIAREQFDQKRGMAQRISRRIIAQETDAELDRRLDESLRKAEQELAHRLVGPLERLSLNPIVVAMNTSQERLTIRYRVASDSQMSASTPRPRAPTDSLLSMQVHQSTINNTIDTLGLSGKTWTLQALFEHLGNAFQQAPWELPDNVPDDVTIRFADSHPAIIELVDGKLRLSLRVLRLQRGNNHPIERFVVTSTYIPLADGMRAELIRDPDSTIEIETRNSGDRIAARIVFAAVFVERPQIPLIADSWSQDPRSEGLAVSQVEIRDGWLAVAISEAGSERAAEVAARSREFINR